MVSTLSQRISAGIPARQTLHAGFAALCLGGLLGLTGCTDAGAGAGDGDAQPAAQTAAGAREDRAAARSDADDETARRAAALEQRRERAAREREAREARTPAATLAPSTLQVEPETLDFGTMGTGETKRGTVILTNVGEEPIIIDNSSTSCGCTVANVPTGEYIAPGDSVEVDVELRAGRRPTNLSKTVTFRVRDQEPVTMRVQGNAVTYVSLEPMTLDPEQMPDGRIVVRAEDGEPFAITAVHPAIIRDVPQAPAAEHELTVSWDQWEEMGQARRLTLHIDHARASEVTGVIRVPTPVREVAGRDVRERTAQRTRPTTLSDLIRRGEVDAVMQRIEEEAVDLESTDQAGKTLLAQAAEHGQIELINALIEAGADVDGPQGRTTPLMAAAQARKSDAVKALIERGADVNARDNALGGTALSLAALAGDTESVVALIEAGADVNVADTSIGFTPLIWAAGFSEDAESVRHLIEAGAEVNVAERAQGATPLIHAANRGQTVNVLSLLDAGADLEARDSLGRTALLVAAGSSGGTAEVVKALIDAGADLTATDRNGNDALAVARNRADARGPDVVALLEQHLDDAE